MMKLFCYSQTTLYVSFNQENPIYSHKKGRIMKRYRLCIIIFLLAVCVTTSIFMYNNAEVSSNYVLLKRNTRFDFFQHNLILDNVNESFFKPDIQEVIITVRGKRKDIVQLSAEDFSLYILTSNYYEPGIYQIPLIAIANKKDLNITIDDLNQSLEVKLVSQ